MYKHYDNLLCSRSNILQSPIATNSSVDQISSSSPLKYSILMRQKHISTHKK